MSGSRILPFLIALWLAACAGHTSGVAGGGTGACETIKASPTPQLPHVSVSGTKVTAITQSLDAIFASQSPPIAAGSAYAIPNLDCADVEPPMGTSGYACTFEIRIAGAQPIAVTLAQPSTLAQTLFEALTAAGAATCDLSFGPHVVLASMTVSAGAVQFDDTSSYQAFPAPNVVAHGADAKSVIDAFSAAGIDDCDPTRTVFLVCNTLSGAPSCGTQWMPLVKLGSSEAIPVCAGSGATSPGATLAAAPSLAIWKAISAAATDAGFQPSNGTIAQATVVNARYFTWDGASLGFTLVMDDATPP